MIKISESITNLQMQMKTFFQRLSKDCFLTCKFIQRVGIYFAPFVLISIGGFVSIFQPEKFLPFFCLFLFSFGLTGILVTWKLVKLASRMKDIAKKLDGTALVIQGLNLKQPELRREATDIIFDDEDGGHQIH